MAQSAKAWKKRARLAEAHINVVRTALDTIERSLVEGVSPGKPWEVVREERAKVSVEIFGDKDKDR